MSSASPPERRRRGPLRGLRHRLRPWLNRPLAALARAVVPALYMAGMRLVFATSRVEGAEEFAARLQALRAEHGGLVPLLWHEEVLTVAYGYGVVAGLEAQALASAGDAGDVITRMLEHCGFEVLRGGSTRHRSRRRQAAALAVVRRMKREGRPVMIGITVDGSKGPALEMKPGGLAIAARVGVPVMLVRTWYQRCWRLPTWDRTALPLPFNRIVFRWRGPYDVGDALESPERAEALRQRLEADLLDLAAQTHRELSQPLPARLARRLEESRARGASSMR